jgi:hypothetical protein
LVFVAHPSSIFQEAERQRKRWTISYWPKVFFFFKETKTLVLRRHKSRAAASAYAVYSEVPSTPYSQLPLIIDATTGLGPSDVCVFTSQHNISQYLKLSHNIQDSVQNRG